jgi:hypothetical protein
LKLEWRQRAARDDCHRTKLDRSQVAIERVHSRTFTGDNLYHRAIEFVPLTHWDVGFHVYGLGEGWQLGNLTHGKEA